jgi:hypothetical protein
VYLIGTIAAKEGWGYQYEFMKWLDARSLSSVQSVSDVRGRTEPKTLLPAWMQGNE